VNKIAAALNFILDKARMMFNSSAALRAFVDLLANRPGIAACAAYVPNTPPQSLAHALHLNPSRGRRPFSNF